MRGPHAEHGEARFARRGSNVGAQRCVIRFVGRCGDVAGWGYEARQCARVGAEGLELGWGRKLRAHKVTSAELGDYIERIVSNFARERTAGERFADWVARADEEALR